jgi:hypothetical protein
MYVFNNAKTFVSTKCFHLPPFRTFDEALPCCGIHGVLVRGEEEEVTKVEEALEIGNIIILFKAPKRKQAWFWC